MSQQLDMSMDALSVDWRISMAHARATAGPSTVLQGNVDPMVLYGTERQIRSAVKECIQQATSTTSSGGVSKHVLNLGHGVEKETPEEAVRIFVDAAREFNIA